MASNKNKVKSNDSERAALVLHGVVAILFGIAAVFWPGLTTLTLVYLVAAFLLIDGVIGLIWGLTKLGDFLKGILIIILGLIEIGVGLYFMRQPGIGLATLLIILGFVLVVRGVIAFVHMFTEKTTSSIKAMHGILGVLGVVIGIFILLQPVASGVAFVWVLGLYALISGAVMIAMAAAVSNK